MCSSLFPSLVHPWHRNSLPLNAKIWWWAQWEKGLDVLFNPRYPRCSSNWKSCQSWQNLRRVSWRFTSRASPNRSWTMTSTTLAPWEGETDLEEFCNELYLLLIQNEVATKLGPEGKNPLRQWDWRQRVSLAGLDLFHATQSRSKSTNHKFYKNQTYN